jgi:hypothetical protein
MEMFDYVVVITSIIIGLAIAHLLQGVAQIIQHPGRRPVYWVHLVWVAYLFLNAVFWWWWEYRLREIATWTFELYFFVLTYAFVIYLSCALLFPKDFHEYQGFKDYFYSRRRWFFGLQALWQVIDLADTWFKGADYFASLGPEYSIATGALLALALVGAGTRSERYHASYAVFALAYNVSWALRMFHTMN